DAQAHTEHARDDDRGSADTGESEQPRGDDQRRSHDVVEDAVDLGGDETHDSSFVSPRKAAHHLFGASRPSDCTRAPSTTRNSAAVYHNRTDRAPPFLSRFVAGIMTGCVTDSEKMHPRFSSAATTWSRTSGSALVPRPELRRYDCSAKTRCSSGARRACPSSTRAPRFSTPASTWTSDACPPSRHRVAACTH